MRPVVWLLNTAWMLKCGAEVAAFGRASRRVAEVQARLLVQTLQANRDTAFGRAHGFEDITDIRTYRERVPLATYDHMAGWIRRIAAGEANVLTSEPVRLLEPTSGTTGGEKLVPYTAGLRRQFQRGVAVWIADLFRQRPAIRGGRAYWSISPMLGPPRRSPGGLPIGFEDDAAYLGWAERFALRRLLVTPAEVSRLPDMKSFRYCTLLSLLAADDLTLISVWSPTFLTSLLAPLEQWQERLCHDLRRGSLSPPPGSGLTPGERGVSTPCCGPEQRAHAPRSPGVVPGEEQVRPMRRWLRPNPARADRLASVLCSSAPWADRLRQVWPHLALVSCWADAAAARFLPELRALFPDVEVQTKGLLATEGFVSLPLLGQPGAALAVRSHFFEFEEQGGGQCRLAHELARGGRYRIILTTAGGLYRYQLRDEVEVVGFHHQCPLLRFVGKSEAISDLVGEKLAEPHVRAVLDRLLAAQALQPRFALLVPILDRPARYRLYIQGPGITDDSTLLDPLRQGLEDGLQENPYYRHAVAAGQLVPVEVTVLDPDGDSAWLLYERRCLKEGQRCGNIKPMALDPRTGWPEVFADLQAESARNRK
jgi:hypothetical protein